MKNLSKYTINEDIGTVHWFRTLVCNAKHMGEFLKSERKNSESYQDLAEEYGEQIENIMSDLIEWQETNQPLRP